jgi:hypothetical protein
MPRRMKVFLPSWIRWMVGVILLLVWALITYAAFFVPAEDRELDIVGWLAISGVLILVFVMIWLMSSGKLPAYEIEVDDDFVSKGETPR